MKKAVIVAAGKSSRLYPRTENTPKALLPLGEKRIIEHSISHLKEIGIDNIAIVTGFLHEEFPKALGGSYTYIVNPFFSHCNNMGSLWMAKSFINNEPFVYLHSDIAYDSNILKQTFAEAQARDTSVELVVDFKETDLEAMKVRTNEHKLLIESNKEIPLEQAHGEWTGIAYIKDSAAVLKQMEQDLSQGNLNSYDTFSFTNLVNNGHEIYCSSTNSQPWVEIDFEDDYQQALKLFT